MKQVHLNLDCCPFIFLSQITWNFKLLLVDWCDTRYKVLSQLSCQIPETWYSACFPSPLYIKGKICYNFMLYSELAICDSPRIRLRSFTSFRRASTWPRLQIVQTCHMNFSYDHIKKHVTFSVITGQYYIFAQLQLDLAYTRRLYYLALT